MIAHFLVPLTLLFSIFKDLVVVGVRNEIPLVVDASHVTLLTVGYQARKSLNQVSNYLIYKV